MRARVCWVGCLVVMAGCGGGSEGSGRDFFTSGSREADQRAEQRVARDEQLEGGEAAPGDGEPRGVGGAEMAPEQVTLYERLGGERGLQAIVDDFVDRALADPRVNWRRTGVGGGGLINLGGSDVEWQATPQNVETLKRHMAQFLSVATGGPARYDGENMKAVHAGMNITNAEFDAAVGDLKATLDKLKVPNQEQKELLAVVESTRAQVVEKR